MRTVTPDARVFPRFAGLSTFFRMPYEEKPKDLDWVVYGVPFDISTSYRPGARFGPRSIREQSAYIKPYHLVYEQHLFEKYSMADGGDCPISAYSMEETLERHEAFASAWRKKGAKTFAVGGDHSIALGNIRATAKAIGEPVGLIHFDSHTDAVPLLWGQKFSHASFVVRSIEEGYVDPKKSICIGVKGPVNTATEFDWGKKQGITYVTYDDWRKNSDKKIQAFRDKLKKQPMYLTFDVDAIDPAYAPGTGTPSIGGFTSSEVIELIRIFRGIRLEGGDIVEVSPPYDAANITSLLAAHLMFEILSL